MFMQNTNSAAQLKIVDYFVPFDSTSRLKQFVGLLGLTDSSAPFSPENLPFSTEDVTVGVENELQTVVAGSGDAVDLPSFIQASNYYKNLQKRSATGDTPLSALQDLDAYLNDNTCHIWENSWVSFPRKVLSDYANTLLKADIQADKSSATDAKRSDMNRFFHVRSGAEHIRIPVSYLLKLSLADAVCPSKSHHMITRIGERLSQHFLNDNTSPETYSFFPVSKSIRYGVSQGIVRETLKRFLLTQLLIVYANIKFRLRESGQQAMVYFAPNTPFRQKMLNDLIPDAFYRELFISPCLSGWDNGEDKHRYMLLCHQVLSRSQLNAVAKLKEAGIITNNLIVLPNTSNTSLTNNGTHISLGSRKLKALLDDKTSGFRPVDEKYFGDLAIKIIEHFLPLFIGTYSASPYRLDFRDFHPEKALGFLPHELDYTHIRMIWRRWKNKANLKLFGKPLTPFGPDWLDNFFSHTFGLKGDAITDFRLIDYLVCLMSTDESPALNGRLGNDDRLKKDLFDLGIFDTSMSLYLFCRLRQYKAMGFSGFENRIYSQFASLKGDFLPAVDLQQLITAYAYKRILSGKIDHQTIPDDPFIESERRQIIFGSAIGIPTFYVKAGSRNRFLQDIIKRTPSTRRSRRYQGYYRVLNIEYLHALIAMLKADAADLIELMNMTSTLSDLINRIDDSPNAAAEGKLTQGILATANATRPLKLTGEEFNTAAEAYYRDYLRVDYLQEAFDILEEDFVDLDSWESWRSGIYSRPLLSILNGKGLTDFLASVQHTVIDETISETNIRKLIHLVLLTIDRDIKETEKREG